MPTFLWHEVTHYERHRIQLMNFLNQIRVDRDPVRALQKTSFLKDPMSQSSRRKTRNNVYSFSHYEPLFLQPVLPKPRTSTGENKRKTEAFKPWLGVNQTIVLILKLQLLFLILLPMNQLSVVDNL